MVKILMAKLPPLNTPLSALGIKPERKETKAHEARETPKQEAAEVRRERAAPSRSNHSPSADFSRGYRKL